MKVKNKGKYDFSNGVQVKEETIKEWHEMALTQLTEEGIQFTVFSSGNSTVIGLNYGKHIEIYEVTAGYVIHNYKIKKK